jgi:hypothetical protein
MMSGDSGDIPSIDTVIFAIGVASFLSSASAFVQTQKHDYRML